MNGTNHQRRAFVRRLLQGAAGLAALQLLPAGILGGTASARADIIKRPVPRLDTSIPAIGMGTYITFNVGPDPDLREQLLEVLRVFFAEGGGLIDSSPMYGTSEAVLGDLLARLDDTSGLFSATKVWTGSTAEGREQLRDSLDLWGLSRLDLEQVHNLVNWRGHMPALREAREDGLIRSIGVTTSHGRRHGELERVLRDEPLDFIQLTYNVVDRAAEHRLLPLARERGVAVIANRPFRGGNLFQRVRATPLPDWTADYGIDNWAQFFLKFIISHDAVTCAIPATSQPEHMRENMGALHGPLPDAGARRRMSRVLDEL